MNAKLAAAFASVRDRADDLRDQVRWVRESAPSLTTGLLLATTVIGFAGGWYVSKPVTRWQVNKEWRTKIAAKSLTVRNIIETGDAEIAATDDDIINALGDTDAKLANAERNLKNSSRPSVAGDRCRIPADCLQRK